MPQSVWISHSGVKGMHWYQHMPHVLARMSERRRAKKEAQADARSAKTAEKAVKGKTNIGSLSDDDLKKVVDRLTLEKRYYDLIKELNPKKQSAVASLLKELAEHTIREVAKAAIGEKIDDRYGKNKNSRKQQDDDDGSDAWTGEDTSKMSDKDLNDKTERLRKEDEYRRLTKKLRG